MILLSVAVFCGGILLGCSVWELNKVIRDRRIAVKANARADYWEGVAATFERHQLMLEEYLEIKKVYDQLVAKPEELTWPEEFRQLWDVRDAAGAKVRMRTILVTIRSETPDNEIRDAVDRLQFQLEGSSVH